METTSAKTPPNHVLGYTIRSHTRIFVSYIIPTTLALCVYIVQFVADCAVSYAHFQNHQTAFGWATLSLIIVSPFITFIMILSSKAHWRNPKYKGCWNFLNAHVVRLLLFPFFIVYKFGYRIFWSIEALFQEYDDKERMACLEKATECDTCELYLFIQAYAQAAPQIILQMYNMLTQDLFRDYQTTTAQGICLVFSAIDLAAITTSYQRFESQRRVGRPCPWATPQELEVQRRVLDCDARLRDECECKKRNSEKSLLHFPQSEKVMENFKRQNSGVGSTKSHEINFVDFDEVDDDNDADNIETTALIHKSIEPIKTFSNATDDDKIRSNPKLNLPTSTQNQKIIDEDEILVLDTIPDSPAPLPPLPPATPQTPSPQLRNVSNEARHKRTSNTLSQLETFKDMLIINAQLYIKEHVPHPPKMLIQRVEPPSKETNTQLPKSPPASPLTPRSDEVDFFLPRPTKIVNGIQQEDFAAKTVAFFGWISYLIMRMLSLAAFSCFYPKAFFILLGVHYIVMLIGLCFESRYKGKFNASLYFIVLAYVFIFVILEFRIKFQRIRFWFVGYFIVTMVENIVITSVWNSNEEFESWWFGFITEAIIYSGILFMATLIVYYYLLKPKDVTLIVEEDLPPQK